MRMDDLGRRTEVESPTPEEKAVIDMIRFSPRRATLGSKEWQTIRIMVRKPAGLTPGEYRAHLRVAPIPPDQLAPGEAAGSGGKNDEQDPERVSINLNVLFAITIPVIIRHGEGGVSVTAGKPSLKRQPDQNTYLEVPLTRSGNHSAYFDITAYQLAGGKRMKAGELKGVSIYTPNTRVYMSIPLEQSMVSRLTGSPVELVIHDLEKRETPVSGSWQFVLD